jgi:photosystem II stability/assembly factor-like uncharacterized protein
MDHRRETGPSFRLAVTTVSALALPALAVQAQACVIPISTSAPSDAATTETSGTTGTTDGHADVAASDAFAAGTWTNRTGTLAGISSQCGNLSGLFAKPDEDLLIASVALVGLLGSRDGGATWTALSPDAGPGQITNRGTCIAFDPTDSRRYWESGLYNGNGVYVTQDDGATFTPLGSISHNDCVSIDFTDANRNTLLAGGHEVAQTLWRSSDQGMTWASVGKALPLNTNCTFPLVLGPAVHLVGCGGNGGGVSGVYRTTDGGGTWQAVTSAGGSGPPLHHSDKSIYWASPNGGVTRSTDDGQTWSANNAATVVSSKTPIELPDGRVAAIGAHSDIVVSADHGVTWKAVSAPLPYGDAIGIVYSAQRKAFYTWHFTCGFNGPVPVPPDAVMSFPFDYKSG